MSLELKVVRAKTSFMSLQSATKSSFSKAVFGTLRAVAIPLFLHDP